MANNSLDIITLNKTKEYTLLASSLWEGLLTDLNLTGQTTKLWQLLYNKAKCNKDLSVTIRKKELAKQLNKTAKTITRYINILVDNGYLHLSPNFKASGRQLENTYFITFPHKLLQAAENKTDRRSKRTTTKKQLSQNDAVALTYENYAQYKQKENHIITNPMNHSAKGNLHEHKPKASTISSFVHSTKAAPSHERTPYDCDTQVKRQRSIGGKNVPPKDNKKLNINNKINNNTNFKQTKKKIDSSVVFSLKNYLEHNEKEKQRIEKYKQCLPKAKKLLLKLKIDAKKAEQTCFAEKDQTKKIAAHTKWQSICAQMDQVELDIDKFNQGIKQAHSSEDCNRILTQPDYFYSQPGNREITKQEFNYLKNNISQYDLETDLKNKLINEIVFAVRFGELKISYMTQSETTTLFAINIALKLVREGRWTIPSLLKKQICSGS